VGFEFFQIVRSHQHSFFRGTHHALEIFGHFLLEAQVGQRRGFVKSKKIVPALDENRKAKPADLPRGQILHREIQKLFEFGKGENLLKPCVYLADGQTVKGPQKINIIDYGQMRVHACPVSKQRFQGRASYNPAFGGMVNAAGHAKQCGFSRSIAPDQSNFFAFLHFE